MRQVDSADHSRQEQRQVAVVEDNCRAQVRQAAVRSAGQIDKDRSKLEQVAAVAELVVEVDNSQQADRMQVAVADNRVEACVCRILSCSRLCPYRIHLASHQIPRTELDQETLHVHLVHTAPEHDGATAASPLDHSRPALSPV